MITPQDIADAYNKAGIDTVEQLTTRLTASEKSAQLRQLEIQINALGRKRAEATKPIDDLEIDLTNQRNALIAELNPE